MSKAIENTPIGGKNNVHFHEDGLFEEQSIKGSTAIVSPVLDYGESLSGICLRAVAEENITGGTAVNIILYVGDDKNAAGTDTAAWTAKCTSTLPATASAGDTLFSFVCPPGEAKKYCYGKLTPAAGASGVISVWNEIIPGRAEGK